MKNPSSESKGTENTMSSRFVMTVPLATSHGCWSQRASLNLHFLCFNSDYKQLSKILLRRYRKCLSLITFKLYLHYFNLCFILCFKNWPSCLSRFPLNPAFSLTPNQSGLCGVFAPIVVKFVVPAL